MSYSYQVTDHLSEGSLVRNGGVQNPRFDPNPALREFFPTRRVRVRVSVRVGKNSQSAP